MLHAVDPYQPKLTHIIKLHGFVVGQTWLIPLRLHGFHFLKMFRCGPISVFSSIYKSKET